MTKNTTLKEQRKMLKVEKINHIFEMTVDTKEKKEERET